MTELNLAYDQMNEYDLSPNQQSSQTLPSKQQQIQEERQYQIQQAQIQAQQQAQQQAQMQQVQQQAHMQLQQSQNKDYYQKRYPEYSFWDRMVMSRREVLKLFILSIVIILGISLEKIGSHYISTYLNSTDLSSFQEFMVRLSFPICVFLILWIIKSL